MSPHPNQPNYKLSTFDTFFRWLETKPEGRKCQRVILRCSRVGNRLSDLFNPDFTRSIQGRLFVQKVPQWAQLKVQVFRFESKSSGNLVHLGFQTHQRLPHFFYFCIA